METGLLLYELAGADPALRFSPHCWKTRMALAHKGLEAQRLPWRFTEADTIAFSGQRRVPVLVDQGTVLHDSWNIAIHLDQQYGERPSLFAHPSAASLTRFANAWADGALGPALFPLIILDIYNCIHEKDRPYFRASREQRLGKPLEAFADQRPAHLADLRKCLQPLRHLLELQPFISGRIPAYADYCVFGMFMWARCCSAIELIESNDPVYAWRDRMLDLYGGLARSASVAHPQ